MYKQLLPIGKVAPGMTIYETIYDSWGRNIATKGEVLTQEMVDKLYRQGLKEVPIALCGSLTNDLVDCVTMISNVNTQKNPLLYDKLQTNVKSVVNSLLDEENMFDIANLQRYDAYTCSHSMDVATLSLLLGIGCDLSEEKLQDLYISALLHDIGKMSIPESIIKKPGRLTDNEFAIVQQHPSSGVSMLAATPLYKECICEGILYHHENYNGSGYPQKLHGESTPIFAKIIHIADVYDALTTKRPYRTESSLLEAYNYISDKVNIMFDPKLVNIFRKKIQPLDEGSVVKLSDGGIGIVSKTNKIQTDKPVVFLVEKREYVELAATDIYVTEQLSF